MVQIPTKMLRHYPIDTMRSEIDKTVPWFLSPALDCRLGKLQRLYDPTYQPEELSKLPKQGMEKHQMIRNCEHLNPVPRELVLNGDPLPPLIQSNQFSF